MITAAKLLKPTILFAAGGLASAANAAVTIDTTSYAPGTGTNPTLITLGAAATPQYSFAKNESTTDFVLSGLGGAQVTTTGQAVAGFPTSNAIFGTSVITGNVASNAKNGAPLADQYFGLKFDAGSTAYTGYAKVDGSGLTLSEIQYQPAAVVAAVPEPETWALMIAGFGGVGLAMRRRRRQTAVAAAA